MGMSNYTVCGLYLAGGLIAIGVGIGSVCLFYMEA